MDKSIIKPGDFFIVDSNRTGARIVKFLMTAPNMFVHLWRKIRGTQEKVFYYHAGIFSDPDNIIEQQKLTQEVSSSKLLSTGNNLLIFRVKNLNDEDRYNIVTSARETIGDFYGVVSCIGKTLTWITTIKWFARHIYWGRTNICINKACKWYLDAIEENFGSKYYHELTTHLVYKYVMAYPEKVEIVYKGIPREEN